MTNVTFLKRDNSNSKINGFEQSRECECLCQDGGCEER